MAAPSDERDLAIVEQNRRVDSHLRRLIVFLHRLTLPFVRYDIQGGAHLHESSRTSTSSEQDGRFRRSRTPASGRDAFIIVGNHRSLLDMVVGLYTAHLHGIYPRVLIARRFVESPFTGPIARWMGVIPVTTGREGGAALDAGVDALRSGLDAVVMPEGRLHRDREDRLSVAQGRTGVSRLAVGAGVPVVIAGVLGADRAWRPGRPPRLNPFRRRVVAVRVADHPMQLHGDDHRANTDAVMAAIQDQIRRAAADHPDLL